MYPLYVSEIIRRSRMIRQKILAHWKGIQQITNSGGYYHPRFQSSVIHQTIASFLDQ